MTASKNQSLVDSLAEVFERFENPERIVAALVREIASALDLAALQLVALDPAAQPALYQVRPLATYHVRRSHETLPPATEPSFIEIPPHAALASSAPLVGDVPEALQPADEPFEAAIPLVIRQTPRALLLLRPNPGARLDPESCAALKPLLLCAVTAHRAFSRFRRYETQLERQLRVSPEFRFDQLQDELFVRARKIFGSGRMFVLLSEPDEHQLRLLAANWHVRSDHDSLVIPASGGPLGEVLAGKRPTLVRDASAVAATSAEAELLGAPFLVVPVIHEGEAIGLFGLERGDSLAAELDADAEAETFFVTLGRILFYSRVHQSLLVDNRRVSSVNRATRLVREGVFQVDPGMLDRTPAGDRFDGLPQKTLAELADELKSGIDLLVAGFSQVAAFVDALYQVGNAGFDPGEDVGAYLHKVVRLLRDRLGYERVIALLADEQTGVLHSPIVSFTYESPEEADKIRGVNIDYRTNRKSVWAWVARSQREIYVPDAHADFVEVERTGERVYISRELVQLFKGNSFLSVPLLSRQQTGSVPKLLGLLSVAALHSNRIRKSDLNVMRTIARQVSLTLENASLHDHLQKQIVEQDRELQKQRQELRESYYRLFRYERNEFHLDLTAGLAHDLKNPLIAGRQYLQVLKMELDAFLKASSEGDERLLGDFQGTAQKYIDKVSDVLLKVQERLRDIELRATETEPENNEHLCDVLTAMSESLADIPQALRSGIAFHRNFLPVPRIRSHPDSLRSLFMNLITNAIEAIPKERGGDVWLTLRREGTEIVLMVEDNGRGIPPQDIDKVFQARFTTKPRGTGLGLAWVQRNVTQHLNGKIYAESGDLGEGKRTRFTVRLPTAPAGNTDAATYSDSG